MIEIERFLTEMCSFRFIKGFVFLLYMTLRRMLGTCLYIIYIIPLQIKSRRTWRI